MSSSRHQGYMVGRVGRVVGLWGASDAAPLGCFEPVCRFQGRRGGWVGIGTGATEKMGGVGCGREGLYGVKEGDNQMP